MALKPNRPEPAAKCQPISFVHEEAKEVKSKQCHRQGHISSNRNCPALSPKNKVVLVDYKFYSPRPPLRIDRYKGSGVT
ncbi:hypothetical protein Ddc_15617 [Ditylenchus destructor]|nr:hypothetical protein Ddc_15617 [Ditylenchus destructor]